MLLCAVLGAPAHAPATGALSGRDGGYGRAAHVYGLDRTKAMTAGLVHDAARDLKASELMSLAAEGCVELQYTSTSTAQ